MKKDLHGFKIAIGFMFLLSLLCGAVFAAQTCYFAGGKESSTSQNPGYNEYFGGASNDIVASTNFTVDCMAGYSVYGGGRAGIGSETYVAGNANLTLTGSGKTNFVYGGGYAESAGYSVVSKDVLITVNDAPVLDFIYGGGRAAGNFVAGLPFGAVSDVKGNVYINIKGGYIQNTAHHLLAGGGEAYGYKTGYGPTDPIVESSANVEGTTNITITGGTIGGSDGYGAPVYMCGGGFADWYSISTTGDTNITIAGGKFTGNVVVLGGGFVPPARDYAKAIVNGNSNIVIKGSSGLASAGGISEFYGSGFNCGSDKSMERVRGVKTLKFDHVGKGVLSAGVMNFDVVVIDGLAELTFTKPISTDVKTVKVTGDVPKDTVVLTLAEESFTPAVDASGQKAKWDGLKLVVEEGGTPGPQPDPKQPGATPTIPVFSGDVVVPASIDLKAPVPAKDEAAAAAAIGNKIASADMTTDSAGNPILKKAFVQGAKANVTEVYSLPIFTAKLVEYKDKAKLAGGKDTVAVAFEVASRDLLADTAGAVNLVKIKDKTTALDFAYAEKAADFADGKFTIQKKSDNSIMAKDAKLTDNTYIVTLFIRDNGNFDLDPAVGTVADPSSIVKTETQNDDSGSSGCNGGFAAFALLAFVPVIMRRKK